MPTSTMHAVTKDIIILDLILEKKVVMFTKLRGSDTYIYVSKDIE